jgi:hypothetical protein
LALTPVALLAGCNNREPIEQYTVAKPAPAASPHAPPSAAAEQTSAEPTDRMLAAIVPHQSQGWFFKLTGPIDAVAARAEAFTEFLKSVRFSDDGKPRWTLPEGWQERPGSDIRYATLVVPSDGKPMELSVTALPKPPGDDEQYALVNINRWRGQMKLPPIALGALADGSQTFELDGTTATMVDLVGTASSSMGRPPFFPGAGNGN